MLNAASSKAKFFNDTYAWVELLNRSLPFIVSLLIVKESWWIAPSLEPPLNICPQLSHNAIFVMSVDDFCSEDSLRKKHRSRVSKFLEDPRHVVFNVSPTGSLPFVSEHELPSFRRGCHDMPCITYKEHHTQTNLLVLHGCHILLQQDWCMCNITGTSPQTMHLDSPMANSACVCMRWWHMLHH